MQSEICLLHSGYSFVFVTTKLTKLAMGNTSISNGNKIQKDGFEPSFWVVLKCLLGWGRTESDVTCIF